MATVLITGTSTGIGLATALAFGRAGHRVAATMRNPGRAPALAEAAARENLPITVLAMDVDSDASVRDGVARIERDAGAIDVLVNNAGIERMGSVEELPLADFRAVMETNYFGVIRCTQAVLPAMRQRRSGCIVNVASVAGHVASSPMAAYTSSKFALEALSECLAQEMKGFNVRVAIVEPELSTPRWLDTSASSSRRRRTRTSDAWPRCSPPRSRRRSRRRWWPTRFSTSPSATRRSCGIRSDLMPSRFWAGGGR